MDNPFEPSEELASLSSGCVVTETIKSDLLAAKEKGTEALTAFDRLLSDSIGFLDPLPKLRLGTFRDAQKTTVSKEGRAVILRTDRKLFARLLVIGQSRKMDLWQLLVHELGPLPWSLALFDGVLVKTNKAALSKLLEDGIESSMLASSNNSSHHRHNGNASNAEQDTREIFTIGRNDFKENTDANRGWLCRGSVPKHLDQEHREAHCGILFVFLGLCCNTIKRLFKRCLPVWRNVDLTKKRSDFLVTKKNNKDTLLLKNWRPIT